jgi:MoaA/NifB/PqqE/SkfB family radical SAM enzyme
MKCEWCYVPFTADKPDVSICFEIVETLASLGYTALTLGGGDPFQYPFLQKLCCRAKALGLLVHIDTHAIALKCNEPTAKFLKASVHLVGLPIDGPNAEIHDSMRSFKGHFDIVLRAARWLDTLVPIKVNTLVSSQNVTSIEATAELIRSLGASRWSLYEFWPLGPAGRAEASHALQPGEFLDLERRLVRAMTSSGVFLETNAIDARRSTYPIVHNDGAVFVHAATPSSTLVRIGSIFDSTVQGTMLQLFSDRKSATSRYE